MSGKLVLAFLGMLASAGFAYPAWTRLRAIEEDDRESWGPDGVRSGAAAYALGEGRTAILFVHGFGSSPATFRLIASDLAARGYACRALRLPGFSERLEGRMRADDAAWRATLDAEIAALRATHEHVFLAGHSMGGALAIGYALDHPDAIDGLVLIAPLIRVSTRRSLGLPSRNLFLAARRVLPADTVLGTTFPVDLHAKDEDHVELRDRFLPVSAYDAMFRVADRIADRAGDLRLPVLMVVPGSDRVVSRRAALDYFARIGSPRKFLHHAPRAGHVVPLDYGWQEVASAIDTLVSRETAR